MTLTKITYLYKLKSSTNDILGKIILVNVGRKFSHLTPLKKILNELLTKTITLVSFKKIIMTKISIEKI